MKELYRIKPIPFLIWWISCSIFVWPLTAVVTGIALIPIMILSPVVPYEMYDTPFLSLLVAIAGVASLGAIVSFTLASLQRWLLRTKLYWAADDWRRWSIAGGVLGAFAVVGTFNLIEMNISYLFSDDWMVMTSMPLFMLIVSAFQWVALRHAVKQAWLWILGNGIAGFVFSALLVRNQNLNDSAMVIPLFGLAVVAQGFITGYVMLFLFEKKLLPMTPEGLEDAVAEVDKAKPKSVWDDAI